MREITLTYAVPIHKYILVTGPNAWWSFIQIFNKQRIVVVSSVHIYYYVPIRKGSSRCIRSTLLYTSDLFDINPPRVLIWLYRIYIYIYIMNTAYIFYSIIVRLILTTVDRLFVYYYYYNQPVGKATIYFIRRVFIYRCTYIYLVHFSCRKSLLYYKT